jgi:hypothetical protein
MNQFNIIDAISRLPANQSKALTALLKTPSIAAASEECGLSVATVKRYLADENFSTIYRKQRMMILQQTVAGLTDLSSLAVSKIEDAMSSGDPNTELRAACRVLDYATKLVELERRIRDQDEILERLSRVEEASSTNGSSSSATRGGTQWRT